MGNFLARLFGGVLFAVLVVGSVQAETVPATSSYSPLNMYYSSNSGRSSWVSPAEVCPAGSTFTSNGAALPTVFNQAVVIGSCPGATTYNAIATAKCNLQTPSPDGKGCTPIVYTCPAGQNWTLSGNTCTRPDCPAGQTRLSDGTCSAPCQTGDTKTLTVPTGKWAVCGKQFAGCLTGTLNIPTTYCDGSCKYSLGALQSAQSVQGATVDNPKPVFADMTATGLGESCTSQTSLDPGTPPTIPQDNPPCDPGEGVLTSSSGSVKCVPSSTPGNTPVVTTSSSTTTYPDGSTTTTTTTTTTDPSTGRTTTTTTTTNNPGPGGGTQSGTPGTTTTNGDSGGSDADGDGEGDGDQGKKDDFCEKHPESMVCKNSTFSGSCTDGNSAPTCEGDAALCATAKAAYELKCGALGKKGTEYGQKLIEGQDDQAQSLPNPNNPTNYNVGSLGYSDGGGSCPPDLVFNVLGRSTTVSMAEVCTIGGWLGNIGVALSLLIGGFIVIGAIRN